MPGFIPAYLILWLRRGQILPEDTIGLRPEVVLTGKAKDYKVLPDSAKFDSLKIEEPAIIEELLGQPEK